jgi:two-component system, NarL family, response regulator LiaR
MRQERPPDPSVAPSSGLLAAGTAVSEERADRAISVMAVEHSPVPLLDVRRLQHAPGVNLVAETSDGATAVEVAAELRPDVVLMDVDLDVPAPAVIRAITASLPGVCVVALARDPDDPRIMSALAAGACGCLAGDVSTEDILAAVRAADRGESVLSVSVARQLVSHVREEVDGDMATAGLTPRELQVLRLLARGWDNARIGEALYVSRGTVKHHISSILTKLHVDNRIQAAVRAVRGGLVDD